MFNSSGAKPGSLFGAPRPPQGIRPRSRGWFVEPPSSELPGFASFAFASVARGRHTDAVAFSLCPAPTREQNHVCHSRPPIVLRRCCVWLAALIFRKPAAATLPSHGGAKSPLRKPLTAIWPGVFENGRYGVASVKASLHYHHLQAQLCESNQELIEALGCRPRRCSTAVAQQCQ